MYVENYNRSNEATAQERRAAGQTPDRLIGQVSRCDGSTAVITGIYADPEHAAHLTVGKLISVNLGTIRTVGLVYAVEQAPFATEGGALSVSVSVEFLGEVRDNGTGVIFDRGITEYPFIGAPAHRIRASDLRAIYDLGGKHAIRIGSLSQDGMIDATVAVDEMLSRHFAVVGTTGVGKSTAVSLLLRKIVEARPDLSVLIFDPHNEFGVPLADHCVQLNLKTLSLPFWLFRLDELTEVLYRGHAAPPEELELLRDIIVHAKLAHRDPGGVLRRKLDSTGITADTPMPYRMADVLREINDRMGALEAKSERPHLRHLRLRLEAAMNDPLYRFMFGVPATEETIHETIGAIFRIPNDGRPITCFEMAGIPGEVVNAVCSVLARLAFDLASWSDGKFKVLVMCEEAHRYVPSDPRLGFEPTRLALARIAKEGRKYGCHLGVITQRPGDLDPTVLSQCSTIFAMRLSNESDQAIIRSAIGDASASTLAFLPALGQREAIAFGEGVAATMRLRFEEVPPSLLPGKPENGDGALTRANADIRQIIDRMRSVTQPMAGSLLKHSDDLGSEVPDGDAGTYPAGPSLSGGSRFFSR